jgi:hypothetical protein
MYALDGSGAPLTTTCTQFPNAFGCTDYGRVNNNEPVANPYPYTTNTPTVNFDTDYLLDVVTGEMNPSESPQTAVQAQAIAARTYSYYHLRQKQLNPNYPKEINNSTTFQLFVPFRFEKRLGGVFPQNATNPCASNNLTGFQRRLCSAVADRRYVSTSGSNEPLHTEFSADRTTGDTVAGAGGESHMRQVQDPISAEAGSPCIYTDQDRTLIASSHGQGILQRGASRWARGSRCWTADRGNAPWSVRWDRADQI